MKITAVVPAAGKGTRFGSKIPKAFVRFAGKALLVHTLERLSAAHRFTETLVAVERERVAETEKLLAEAGIAARVVPGGRTRAESVRNAVFEAAGADWVLVHDAARPFASVPLVRRVIAKAKETGAALAAVPATATVKRVSRAGRVTGTEDRESLWLAQTPQVFRKDLLVSRYRALGKRAGAATDEAALFDGSNVRVAVVPGESGNVKITTPEDAAQFGRLSEEETSVRVGIGYDIHPLKEGRPLVLGGVTIPYPKGLWGHSDGDALWHAIVDAALGALGEGDIGDHFPPGEARTKGVSGDRFAVGVSKLLLKRGFRVAHVDSVVIAEAPKLGPYKTAMRRNVAAVFGLPISSVSVKGKTNEGFGELGRGEAIACHAVVTLAPKNGRV